MCECVRMCFFVSMCVFLCGYVSVHSCVCVDVFVCECSCVCVNAICLCIYIHMCGCSCLCVHSHVRFHGMVTRIGKLHTLLSSSFFVLQHRTEMFIDPFQISSSYSGSLFIQVLRKSGHIRSRLVADQKAYPSMDTFDSSVLTPSLSRTVVPSLHPCCRHAGSVQHQHHPLPPQALLVRQRQKRAMLDFPCAPPMQSASQRLREMFPDRPDNVLPLVPGRPHLLVNNR